VNADGGRPSQEAGVVAAVDTDEPVDTSRVGPTPPLRTLSAPYPAKPRSRLPRRLLLAAILGALGATAAVALSRRAQPHDVLEPPLETVKLSLVDTSRKIVIRADLTLELPTRHRVSESNERYATYVMKDDREPELGDAFLRLSLSPTWRTAEVTIEAHQARREEILDVAPWIVPQSYAITYQLAAGSRLGLEVVQPGAHGGFITCVAELDQVEVPSKRTMREVLPQLKALCAFTPG